MLENLLIKCVIRYPKHGLDYGYWYKIKDLRIKREGPKHYEMFVLISNAVTDHEVGLYKADNFYTVEQKDDEGNKINELPLTIYLKEHVIDDLLI